MWANVYLFNGLQLAVSGYAWWRGGHPERLVAVMLLAAAGATVLAYSPFQRRFVSVEYGVLAVDLVLLVTLCAIALYANRYWPLGIASLHLAAMIAHLGKLLEYSMSGWGYAFLLKLWAYPMLLTLVLGTMRHRQRVNRYGVDRSWSTGHG